MRKIIITLMAVLLLSTIPVAYAAESPDPNRSCSLTLVMEWDGSPLDSGTLTVFRVGQIHYGENGWTYELIPELQDSGLSLDDLNNAQLPQLLAHQVSEKSLAGITAPVDDGKAEFADLATGLYLVIQEESCESFAAINPFLISLPRWESNRYVYDLTGKPKVSLEPLPTEPTEPEPTDPPEPELPQTGQLNWPVPVLTAAGLALFALGWCLCFGKKRGYES